MLIEKKKKIVPTECDTYSAYYLDSVAEECKLCPQNC